jgi:hypothetical protein
MDTLEQFTLVWCDACGKTRPMTFDVIRADNTSDHDAADIVCAERQSYLIE